MTPQKRSQLTYEWRREPSKLFGSILRPIITITVGFKGKWIPQAFYLDSGADITLLPASVGKLLGLPSPKNNEKKLIHGIGKSGIWVVLRQLDLLIGHKKLKIKTAWAYKDEVPLLLGRLGFFPRFYILLAKGRKTVIWD